MSDILPIINKPTIRKLVLFMVFFITAPLMLISSIFTLTVVADQTKGAGPVFSPTSENTNSGAQIYASLPASIPSISDEVISADARVKLVRNYLISYDSPLSSYTELIISTADKYGLDFRLITAIAQQESNLCKFIPPDSYNCWGWGIHSRGTLHFSSFEEGIEVVSKGLKENYIDLGYTSPDEIMKKYTPMSPGSWANGVNLFMSQME